MPNVNRLYYTQCVENMAGKDKRLGSGRKFLGGPVFGLGWYARMADREAHVSKSYHEVVWPRSSEIASRSSSIMYLYMAGDKANVPTAVGYHGG